MNETCCYPSCDQPATIWEMDTHLDIEYSFCHAHAHLKGVTLSLEEIREAKEWFIHRFCHSMSARNFALRDHELIQMSIGEKKNFAKLRQHNAAYRFQFVATDDHKLLVRPVTEEAEWARGVIWYDPAKNEYRFTTGEVRLITEI